MFIHRLSTDDGHLTGTKYGHAVEEDRAVGVAGGDEAGLADIEVEVLGFDVEKFAFVVGKVVGEIDHGVAATGSYVAIGAVGLEIGTGAGIKRGGFVVRINLASIGQ